MKALTLWQPWASAVAAGLKQAETRSWSTRYRGPLLIHASKLLPPVGVQVWESLRADFARVGLLDLRSPGSFPRGAILGIVDLVSVVGVDEVDVPDLERALGDYSPGRYAWLLERARALPEPLYVRGAQALWTPDRTIVAEVERILSASPRISP